MKKSSPPNLSSPRVAAPEASRLKIMLVRDFFAEESDDSVHAIRSGLADAGYDLVSIVNADLNLSRHIDAAQPDLLIIESETAARDLVENVCVSTQHQPRPIVLFTGNNDNESIRTSLASGITGYIVDGLKPERVKPVLDVALARFEFEQQLKNELEQAQNKLSERKLLEKAKGLLMQQLNVTEDDAYRRLRKLSMDKNIRLIEAAQMIINVSAALG